jgi:3-methyladenine DNA glycosylase AlkD
MTEYNEIITELQTSANKVDAAFLQTFFKTGPGQYGEGDCFIGVRMPAIRSVVKSHRLAEEGTIQRLMQSPIHEYRMCAALLLVEQYRLGDDSTKHQIYVTYLRYLRAGYINNWDLIDVTVHKVIGQYLLHNDRTLLYELADNASVWQRRAAIISTFAFIAHGEHEDALQIANKPLHDNHDLIHKAIGWVLREVGKSIDERILRTFLDTHASEMPRTMLRYAIERLPEVDRQHYLAA